MRNENIGELGRAFIAQRTELGIDFDDAWSEWQHISTALTFVLIDCPEVRHYDYPWLCDRDERLRIRRLAREKIGKHIRSAHVSALAAVAERLDVRKPVPPYQMDRQVVRKWLARLTDQYEIRYGYTEEVATMRLGLDEKVETYAQDMEPFVVEHSLWAVSPVKLVGLYANHLRSQDQEGLS